MLAEKYGFLKVSELSSCLGFATESVSELFKLSYLNLFKSILVYLNPLNFFHFLFYQTNSFRYLELTFFFRIVQEEKYIYVQTFDTILTEILFLI